MTPLHHIICGTRAENLATAQAESARRSQAMARRINQAAGEERTKLEHKAAQDAALWRDIVAWAVDCGPCDVAPLAASARTTADHFIAAMRARPMQHPPVDPAADQQALRLHQLACALENDLAWRLANATVEERQAA
jgi:hypothetical protein